MILPFLTTPPFVLLCCCSSIMTVLLRTQVLVASCSVLRQLSSDVSSEGRLLSLHLQLVLELTATTSWPIFPAPLQPPLARLTENFLQHLVNRDLYPTLKVCASPGLLLGLRAARSLGLTGLIEHPCFHLDSPFLHSSLSLHFSLF